MTRPVDTCRPLSPATAQWTHEQVAPGAGVEVMHGLSTWTPLTEADLATGTAERPVCQQQSPTPGP